MSTVDYLHQMILSASGWRAVFAASGDEESTESDVKDEFLVLVGIAAQTFADELSARGIGGAVVVGTDTRPTGPAIEEAAIRVFVAAGREVRRIGIAAIPEVISFANSEIAHAAFFYVSASHNPIGHNGIKMGIVPGGVVGGEDASRLIAEFRTRAADHSVADDVWKTISRPRVSAVDAVYGVSEEWKAEALESYRRSTWSTLSGPGRKSEQALGAFRASVGAYPCVIIAELNGSARAATLDRDFLSELTISTHFLNDRPGAVVHQIVPEGPGLDMCRAEVATIASTVESGTTVLGYVPDNDGDRGNLVYYDPEQGATAIDAQSVFALACVAELSWLVATEGLDQPKRHAIVVNGPTSGRIERIAELFGVAVSRTEVGEANVLQRAAELRSDGITVRLIGEGSNGGTIIHPALVRDPLNTVGTVLKLLATPETDTFRSPLSAWAERCGSAGSTTDRDLAWVMKTLPAYTTTSAFEPLAVMRVATEQASLKRNLESRLPERFADMAERLKQEAGVCEWSITNYEGTVNRHGPGNRTGSESGGLKIHLCDDQKRERGFLWMRGSKTEPVLRVMVDLEGVHPHLERDLLTWLRALVAAADGQ